MADTRVRPYAHGTWQKYRYERCRCPDCRIVTNRRRREREHQKLIDRGGVPPVKIDAEPVREHVRGLMARGVGWCRVARLAGVSQNCVDSLLRGRPWIGQPPTRWVRPETAERLLAVTDEQHSRVDVPETAVAS